MTGHPSPVPVTAGMAATRLHVPTTPGDQVRHAAIILIAIGLDQQPGDPWGVAHDIAEAFGLLPTVTAHPRHKTLTDDRPARKRT